MSAGPYSARFRRFCVGFERDRERRVRERVQEVACVERLACGERTVAMDAAIEDALQRFDQQWCGDGVDVASAGDGAINAVAAAHAHIDDEALRGTAAVVGGGRRW